MKIRLSCAAVCLYIIAFPASLERLIAMQEPGADAVINAKQAVVQIFSTNCDNGDRHASGFIWRDSSTVVTDLHVVSGCRSIRVYLASVRKSYDATAERALAEADLALLHLNEATPARPLALAARPPRTTDALQAVGYLLDVPEIANKRMEVMDAGSGTLDGFLPDNLKQIVRTAGSPSLSVKIVRLDGSLLPGASGAPLVNTAGQVSGVGSGGLENGAAGISWAIQSDYVATLTAAPLYASARTSTAPKQIFFSAETPSSPGASGVRCGERVLTLLKTRPLGQLIPSVDDPIAFMQLASTGGMPMSQIGGFKLDSYVDADSGGVVALPAGTQLTAGTSFCKAANAGGALEARVFAASAGSLMEAQSKSTVLEQSLAGDSGLYWARDPSFTYPAPHQRADGLIANRSAYVGAALTGVTMPAVKAAAVETIIFRPNVLIGIVVINRQYNPPLYSSCAVSPGLPNCNNVLQFFRLWATAALGANLSTFPIR